jgi:hypothetical protein
MSADAYLNAKAAFERVDANVTNLAQRIGKIAEVLRANRSSFCFFKRAGLRVSA